MSDEGHETVGQIGSDVPRGEGIVDDEYKSRPGESYIPVQSDDKPVEQGIDPRTADSDEQLERDEREAIDESNIIDSRTRGATKKAGTYREPGDEEGLPGPDDGTSSVRTGTR